MNELCCRLPHYHGKQVVKHRPSILKGLVQKDEGIVRFYKWDLAQLDGLS